MTPYTLFQAEMSAEVLDAVLLEGARFEPLEIDGTLAGAALVDGTEVHFVAAPEWRGGRLGTRKTIRGFLQRLVEKSDLGFLTTRVLNTHENDLRFVQRVGFKKTWDDGAQTFFMLSEPPFQKAPR